jgi:hypothetical protein
MLWAFMGSSRWYQFLAGLIETTAGLLLLFRRTATLGSLVALPALVSVLMVNIAYDTWLKIVAAHLMLFSIFILSPNISRLYRFFILKQNTALSSVPPIIEDKKYRWPYIVFKFIILLLILTPTLLLPLIKGDLPRLTQNKAPYYDIVGIHQIEGFQLNQSSGDSSSMPWNKVAVDNNNQLAVQFQNDSIAKYSFEADTASRTLRLTSLQDTSIKHQLTYAFIKPTKLLFTGSIRNSSVRFISKQTRPSEVALLKGYGKVKWIYD